MDPVKRSLILSGVSIVLIIGSVALAVQSRRESREETARIEQMKKDVERMTAEVAALERRLEEKQRAADAGADASR